MESEVSEVIEERESERIIRERFRRLLCCKKDFNQIVSNDNTSEKQKSEYVKTKKTYRKRSIHILQSDCNNEEIRCLPRSPSSPFLDYSQSAAQRKPIIRRSESLGYCFSFDGENEGLDIDSFHNSDIVPTEMISSTANE